MTDQARVPANTSDPINWALADIHQYLLEREYSLHLGGRSRDVIDNAEWSWSHLCLDGHNKNPLLMMFVLTTENRVYPECLHDRKQPLNLGLRKAEKSHTLRYGRQLKSASNDTSCASCRLQSGHYLWLMRNHKSFSPFQ